MSQPRQDLVVRLGLVADASRGPRQQYVLDEISDHLAVSPFPRPNPAESYRPRDGCGVREESGRDRLPVRRGK